MCQLKVINKTKNGLFLFCIHAKTYQLTYNNILISLSNYEFNEFKKYITSINCNYWEQEYENSVYERKVPIPSTQSNLILLFNPKEIEEIKELLGVKSKKEFLDLIDIEYKLILN